MRRRLLVPMLVVASSLLLSCSGEAERPTGTAAAGAEAPSAPPARAESLAYLTTSPETGPIGSQFTVSGQGLTPGASLEFVWIGGAGSYETTFNDSRIQFHDRQFSSVTVSLGTATVDAQGRVVGNFTVPEDFGGVHDIYAVQAGQEIAKAGFDVERTVAVTPLQGPVGTTITVRVTGLGATPYTSTASVRYDNRYTGFLSATTTRGTATATFRAAGPEGDHAIEINGASHTLPYLNIEQSAVAWVGTHRFTFHVTGDDGPPAATIDWPDPSRRSTESPFTTAIAVGQSPSVPRATVDPASGPVLGSTRVRMSGLPAGAEVDLEWITVIGADAFGTNVGVRPLVRAQVDASGRLDAAVTVPDTVGGWHAIRVSNAGETVGEADYFVERSLVSITPQRVRAGESFEVHLKGVGWTEVDNGLAVLYDGGYTGYACGSASGGDVRVTLIATGGPGTHLIDIYPMIFDDGHGGWPWQYNTPQLTFAADHPGLALGYRLPALHMAIEIVP